ncbi:hypothetical protein J4434_05390 [Candidatus Woesearchaeota archaeon]|nr:hypothetical protein [Candidatus Woesearchaeota archaeon]
MTDETMHLDIIVASTDVFNIDSLIEDKISKLSKEIGFEYNLEFRPEGWFLGPSWKDNYRDIKQNAIIVTHGGQCVGYCYLNVVKELSGIRHDLRFIVRMERDKILDDFGNNRELFAFYQQLEADFDKMQEAHTASYDQECDDIEESNERHEESFKYDVTKHVIVTSQSLPRYFGEKSFSDIFCYEPHFDSYLKSFVEHLKQRKQDLADGTAKPTQE